MMLDIDPMLVLKSPWLWDAKTIEWAEEVINGPDKHPEMRALGGASKSLLRENCSTQLSGPP